MKLAPRLTLLFLLIAIIPLIIVGAAVYENSRQTIVRQTTNHLISINTLKEAELNRWIEDGKNALELLARRPYFKDSFADVLRAHAPGGREHGKAQEQIVEDHLSPYVGTGNFLEIFILRPEDGRILIATDPAREGKYQEDQSYFVEGRKGTYIQNVTYSQSLDQPVMVIAAPIKDRQDRLIAVLAGRSDLGELTRIMEQGRSFSQTEDTYLVNRFNFFVTEPRFGKNFALKKTVRTRAVNEALKGNSGVGLYNDYREIPVLGAYKWLANRELCLITEIDQSEAFAPVVRMGWIVTAVLLTVACAAALATFFFARTITRPVGRLVQGAGEIGRGRLDYRAGASADDEIGELSRAFDRMATQLDATTVSRDELAREKDFSDSVINCLPGVFYLFDEKGRLIRWNTNFERVTEYSADEVSRMTFLDFISPEQQDLVAEKIEQAFLRGEASVEAGFLTKSGRSVPFFMTGVRVGVGDKRLAAGVGIDIAERKRAEEALGRLNEDLLRSNKDLEEFAYVASHDLQEPLRMVASYTQLLAERYKGQLDEKAMKYIAYAVEGAVRMQQLINGLLTYSRMGARGRPVETVDSHALLGEAIRNLGAAIDESHAIITAEELPAVSADPTQLVHLFQNLLSNAVKFRSEEYPRVHVSAHDAGKEWIFSVKDNGIGIDRQYSDRIFLIFQRLHTRTEYPGTGIGLALCKRIVERHGGRIWFESEPGKGSSFFFSLPK